FAEVGGDRIRRMRPCNVTHIVVPVLRFSTSGRNDVDVEVSNVAQHQLEVAQPRFLLPFAQRGRHGVLTRLEMPAHLQPAIQSPVMVEQQTAGTIEDETARGDVSRLELLSRAGRRRDAEQLKKCVAVWALIGVDDQVEGYHW